MIFFVHTLSPLIFAETTTPANTTTTTTTQTAQATLAKTDITAVGMNMFSTAYNWEVGSNLGYNDDAYK